VHLAVQIADRRPVRSFFVGTFDDYRNLMGRGNVVAESRLLANDFINFKNRQNFGCRLGHNETTAHYLASLENKVEEFTG
jgi:hypothetical protein